MGMSTRAIAPTVGVSKDTVYRDQVYQADTPAAHERIDPRTCEVIPPPARGACAAGIADWTAKGHPPACPGRLLADKHERRTPPAVVVEGARCAAGQLVCSTPSATSATICQNCEANASPYSSASFVPSTSRNPCAGSQYALRASL